MATSREPAAPQIFMTGSEPEYFVTHIETEPADGGNVRVMAYVKKHRNEFHLLYTAVVPLACLATMGRQCATAAANTQNLLLWGAMELREQ